MRNSNGQFMQGHDSWYTRPERKHSLKSKIKMSNAKKGKPFVGTRYEKIGKEHWHWKGDEPRLIKSADRYAIHKKLNSRIVAEKVLERPLKKREVIHHINWDKTNDKPENLYLFRTQSAHAEFHMNAKLYSPNYMLKSNLNLYSLNIKQNDY